MLLHGRIVCGVIRTVIPSPSGLIWDESATSFSNGEGLRRGEGNLSKACHLRLDMALFSQTGLFQTRYLLKALTSDNVLPVLKEPDTAISNSFTRYRLLFFVFNSETYLADDCFFWLVIYQYMTCT